MKLSEIKEPKSFLIHAYLRPDDGEGDGDDHFDMKYELENIIKEYGAEVVRESDTPYVWEIKVSADKIDDLYDELDDADIVIGLYTNEHGPFTGEDPFKSALEKMAGDDPELKAKIAKRQS